MHALGANANPLRIDSSEDIVVAVGEGGPVVGIPAEEDILAVGEGLVVAEEGSLVAPEEGNHLVVVVEGCRYS